MSDDFGSDYITIVDDDGQESELEVVDTIEYKNQNFTLFLPADLSEDDPDYGLSSCARRRTPTEIRYLNPSTMRTSSTTCTSISWRCSSTMRKRNKPKLRRVNCK